MAEELYESVS
jgi:hypothetical protein